MIELDSKKFSQIATTILLFGAILRIIELCLNRSLWCDEALLSLNFLDHDFAGLVKPLDNEQAAPILFLWIEKLMMVLFGYNDFSLRIVPFIISIITLVLFYKLVVKVLGKTYVSLLLLFMFSSSMYLLAYTLEVKQYQGDMLMALFFFNQLLSNNRFNKKPIFITFLVVGCISVWFSNVAVVILCISGLYIFIVEYKAERKISFIWLSIMLAWGISFGFYFWLFINGHPSEAFMLEFWSKHFPPFNIFSQSFMIWLYKSYLAIAQAFVPVAIKYNPFMYLFLLFIVAGIYRAFKVNKKACFILIVPMLVHLVLAFAKKYPIADKFLLYLFPCFYVLVGLGTYQMIAWLKVFPSISKTVAYCSVSGLVVACAYDLYLKYPYEHEEIKKTIAFVNNKVLPGSLIYVNKGAEDVFRFYKRTGVVKFQNQVVFGNRYARVEDNAIDLKQLGTSFWLMFSHIRIKDLEFMLNYLKDTHVVRYEHKAQGAVCYFFEPK